MHLANRELAIVRSAMVDRGNGPAVVLIPGIQGRWEWMAPAVDALAARCRLITFSLRPATSTTDTILDIDAALDEARVERAVILGVSLGGLIALRYALDRPQRTRGIVLASTPGPRWQANRRQLFFAKYWAVASPLFALNALVGMFPELVRARGGLAPALRFATTHGLRVLAHPEPPRRVKERYDLWLAAGRNEEYASISAPTLVVAGDHDLDRVVPVEGTLEYTQHIPGARAVRLEDTGHIGSITRPGPFAEIVASFAANCN